MRRSTWPSLWKTEPRRRRGVASVRVLARWHAAPRMAPMDTLDSKQRRLRGELEASGGVMVAFSGGADSTFLLAAAAEALGERAVAATGVSPSLAEHELADARLLAAELGVRHVVVATHELQRPGYSANG